MPVKGKKIDDGDGDHGLIYQQRATKEAWVALKEGGAEGSQLIPGSRL